MSLLLTPTPTPAVELIDGIPMTRSTDVAEFFGKNHKEVLRAFRNLELPTDVREDNFVPTQVPVEMPNGGERMVRAYWITRKGFTLLGFGFTGRGAMKFKLAYIDAFDAMEQEVLSSRASGSGPAAQTFAPDLQNRVWYGGRPVLASPTLAAMYGVTSDRIGKIKRRADCTMEAGRDYHELGRGDAVRFLAEARDVALCVLPGVRSPRQLTVWTEDGARYLAGTVGGHAPAVFAHLRRTYYAPERDVWESPAGCLDSAMQRAERLLAEVTRTGRHLRETVFGFNRATNRELKA